MESVFVINCKECGKMFKRVIEADKIEDVKEEAKNRGWSVEDDLCPKHNRIE